MNDGDNRVLAKSGDETIEDSAGDDDMFGRADNDELADGVGNDTLTGGENDNTLMGGEGTSTISAFNAAEDTLQIESNQTIDPDTGDPVTPEGKITNFGDGTGAMILIDGVAVAQVRGAQDLDPTTLNLIPITAA